MSIKTMFSKPKPTVVQIQANLTWEGFYDPQSRMWTGVCRALNLNASGETWSDLQAEANEAMQLLFEELMENDELESFLERQGWTPSEPVGRHPGLPTPRFDVPSAWERRIGREELAAAYA
jgi:hypothetical protein